MRSRGIEHLAWQCRRRRPLDELKQVAEDYNKQLTDANQPPLETVELIAANLYTGPVSPHRNPIT